MVDLTAQYKLQVETCQVTVRQGEPFSDGFHVGDDGIFTGRAVVYDKAIQLTPDIVETYAPRVFRNQVKDPSRVKIYLQHEHPIGRVLDFEERSDGLHFQGRIVEELARGHEAKVMLTEGILDELSPAFKVMPHGTHTTHADDGRIMWRHNRAQLMEISLVAWGAQGRDATVTRAAYVDTTSQQRLLRIEQARQQIADLRSRLR